jgi:hypothetical protein
MRPQLKILVINFVGFIFLIQPGFAQTPQQLGSRFTPVLAYWLRPGILMLTRFDATGQICEALIEPVKEGTSKAERISDGVADEVIEEVVPAESRGKESRYLDPDSTVAGGVYKVKSNFEFVNIEKMGNVPQSQREDTIQVIRITWTQRTCTGSR